MKLNALLLLGCFTLFFAKSHAQAPPYHGTIFINPDIITPSDPSAFQSVTFKGTGIKTVFDRRVDDWVDVNAFLFDVIWDDGLVTQAIVNPEFGNPTSAGMEAIKYAFLIGQLPYCLRTDVREIWIHKGLELFGGGNHSILIHTEQAADYEKDGILEETLVHEACHTSLDLAHATAAKWKNAQNRDRNFISAYAKDNPETEDIAESFLPWLMVRYRGDVLPKSDFNSISRTIANRLRYFDEQGFNLYPFFSK